MSLDQKQMERRHRYHIGSEKCLSWAEEHTLGPEEVAPKSNFPSYYADRRVLSGMDVGQVYSIEQERTMFAYRLSQLETEKVEFEMTKAAVNMAVPRTETALIADKLGIKDFESEFYVLRKKYLAATTSLQEYQDQADLNERKILLLTEAASEGANRRQNLEGKLDEHQSKNVETTYLNKQLSQENVFYKEENAQLKAELKQLQADAANLKEQLARDKKADYHMRVAAWANEQLVRCKPHLGITFGSAPREGTLLLTVNNQSSAYGSGLREGDIVASVNGHSTNNQAQFIKHMHGVQPGETFEVLIYRPGIGFFETENDDFDKLAVNAAELAHKPTTVTVRMGALGMSYHEVLSILRLARHMKQPAIYADVNTAASFERDLQTSQCPAIATTRA